MLYSMDDMFNILPTVIVVAWATALILVEAFLPKKYKFITIWLTVLGLVVALVAAINQHGIEAEAFNGMLVVDGFSSFLNILILGSGILAVALAVGYNKRFGFDRGEYYIMMMFSIAGTMLMSSAADLIVIFLALELMSIPLYIMAAFYRGNVNSEEAGMKYFLLGAFAGGFILYGIGFVYGATGATGLSQVVTAINGGVDSPTFLLVGAALILIGLGFKVAAVPFHMWTPDVYEGSPTPATAYMAVGAKVGGFAALIRIFVVAFPTLSTDLVPILWGLVALTLVVGNLVAIAQKNIKRMLAYSSISHAGFILMAFLPYGDAAVFKSSVAAALFYLLAFAITSFGSWGVVIALEKSEGKGLLLEDYAGLGRKYPALGVAMLIFMLSFTGIPPTIGFAGKFLLFKAVMEGGYYGLAILGVLTSLFSAYYYLRLVIIMFMKSGEPNIVSDRWVTLVTASSAVATVVLFMVSTPLFAWAEQAVLKLF
ncbi:MAG: NADH-quinone oxidoreductase subunit N [Chloroflexi bacterium]|jgi:NADH-quinone oxidoreductase subunit N|nr:NADH-quinone oxidoreductase subunit N [Chloroflexota bacterium]MBT3669177.1 NADH-quinone oxidoreductase subunit N [Chloroflexota bacterium]MBT4002713.1 NADH-quinone oxidoreductase subunit N [Chloroflexota bacterium]MBT4306422.1 NADH-quinone oxidoreductase subunit N [Chloroflexota bacterium]MBT4534921.1 NADH-quinone oxidoreductase subunit N [Chloroflexota bacterium]